MDWKLKSKFFFLVGLVFCLQLNSFTASSQESITKEQWQEAKRDIDYGSRKEKEKKEKDQAIEEKTERKTENNGQSFFDLQVLGLPLATIFGGIIFVILAGFLVYLVIGLFIHRDVNIGKMKLSNEEMNMVLEDIEENLHESDLERALRLALEAGNYKAAIRIYYLAVIKDMSIKGLIRWKKDKTNYNYVNELLDTPWHQDFSSVTLAFERIWYGNVTVDKDKYELLTPRFQSLLNKIRANE